MEKKSTFQEIENKHSGGLLFEIFNLIKTRKKYWLIPIIVTLLTLGVLIIMGGSSAAPLIYTLF